MRNMFWVAAAAATVVGLLVSGCAPDQEVDALPPASDFTPAPEATSFPTEEPEPVVPTCMTIISESMIETLEADGFVLIEDHQDHLSSEHSVELMFFDNGGVDCMWGIAGGGDSLVSFGYSTISAADAASAQDRLAESGYQRAESGSDVSYSIDPRDDLLGIGDVFMFTDGEWFHSTTFEAIDEMRAHLG